MHRNDYSHNVNDQLFSLGVKNEDYTDMDMNEELRLQAGINLNDDGAEKDLNGNADEVMDEDLRVQAGVKRNDEEKMDVEACVDNDLINNAKNPV